MVSVKRALELAKRYRGRANTQKNIARRRVDKAMEHAYVGRKLKKREMRSLWIERLNAGVRYYGFNYSRFIHALKTMNVTLDRKVLSQLAAEEPLSFKYLATMAAGKPQGRDPLHGIPALLQRQREERARSTRADKTDAGSRGSSGWRPEVSISVRSPKALVGARGAEPIVLGNPTPDGEASPSPLAPSPPGATRTREHGRRGGLRRGQDGAPRRGMSTRVVLAGSDGLSSALRQLLGLDSSERLWHLLGRTRAQERVPSSTGRGGALARPPAARRGFVGRVLAQIGIQVK